MADRHQFRARAVVRAQRGACPRLCEKPFASNGAEVAEMYAEADKQGVLLQEGMWTRFFPATEVSFPHPWCRTVGRLC